MRRLPLFLILFLLFGAAKDTKRELQEIRRRRAKIEKEIRRLKREEKGVLRRIELLEKKVNLTEKLINQLEIAQSEKQREIERLKISIARTQAQMDRIKDDLSKRLVYIYKYQRYLPLEFLLTTKSIPEAYSRFIYLKSIAYADNRLFSAYRELAKSLEQEKREMELSYEEITRLKKEREKEKHSLSLSRKEKEKVLKSVRREKKKRERIVAELRAREKRLVNLLARLERKKRAKRKAPYKKEKVGRWVGSVSWPYRGRVISSFGIKYNPKYGTKTKNAGIDIRCPEGANVRAAKEGKVAYAAPFEGYGNLIIIDHGKGRHSVYSGLSKILVRVGQRVKRGEVIGKGGGTLHFELRVGGKALNPLNYLR